MSSWRTKVKFNSFLSPCTLGMTQPRKWLVSVETEEWLSDLGFRQVKAPHLLFCTPPRRALN
jgi:hypothetical protein